MTDNNERVIALAEERFKMAESLGVSVASSIARIYAGIEEGQPADVINGLEEIDKAINEARNNSLAPEIVEQVLNRIAALEHSVAEIKEDIANS